MRVIGIRHRVKKTADGEARPTMVAILVGSTLTLYELPDEQTELDFVLGKFPTAFRLIGEDEGFLDFPTHQVTWRELKPPKGSEEINTHGIQTRHLRRSGKQVYQAVKVPAQFDGLRAGDMVAMALGGSGDHLAYALGRQAEKVGATVLRIPPATLKARRDAQIGEEKGDEILLAELARDEIGLFYPLAERDRNLILVRECWRALNEAMKARIGCEQRLRQSFIGRIFTHPDGLYPEGGIEAQFDALKANDRLRAAFVAEEAERQKELTKALEHSEVYTQVLAPVVGAGPRIAARIIASVVDIRRFAEEPDNMNVLIAESYARSVEHAQLGSFTENLLQLEGGKNAYSRINDAARIKKEQGDEAAARHLYAMLREKKVRSQLRRKKFSLSASNLKAFMGVHLLPDGSFPRKRRGQVANWHGDARQALYLLMDQFFKRPDSEWGVRLREEMAAFRVKHPEVVIEEREDPATGKKRPVKKYNDLHIRKMAMWRTANKFVEWFYGEWLKLDKVQAKAPVPLKRAA